LKRIKEQTYSSKNQYNKTYILKGGTIDIKGEALDIFYVEYGKDVPHHIELPQIFVRLLYVQDSSKIISAKFEEKESGPIFFNLRSSIESPKSQCKISKINSRAEMNHSWNFHILT
jgi:hypothetical protein